jgi:hypothetical protein
MAWRAAATPYIRAFWVDAFSWRETARKNALIGFVLVNRRALADGRTGELGVVERLVGSSSEPDGSADLGVDDGIAGDNLAFGGGAVADHPIARLRQSAGSGCNGHRAGQQQ